MEKVEVLPACTTEHCVPVNIINDQAEERTERFGITLGKAPDLDSRITLFTVEGTVEIRDDDGNI